MSAAKTYSVLKTGERALLVRFVRISLVQQNQNSTQHSVGSNGHEVPISWPGTSDYNSVVAQRGRQGNASDRSSFKTLISNYLRNRGGGSGHTIGQKLPRRAESSANRSDPPPKPKEPDTARKHPVTNRDMALTLVVLFKISDPRAESGSSNPEVAEAVVLRSDDELVPGSSTSKPEQSTPPAVPILPGRKSTAQTTLNDRDEAERQDPRTHARTAQIRRPTEKWEERRVYTNCESFPAHSHGSGVQRQTVAHHNRQRRQTVTCPSSRDNNQTNSAAPGTFIDGESIAINHPERFRFQQ